MKTTKKNTWENHKIDVEIKIKNQFSNTLFFFEFSNTLKQIKIDLLNPKTLLKLVAKTLKKMKIFALEIVV